MLDAKAQGYAWALEGNGNVRDFYTGFTEMMVQAKGQVSASGGRPIEWYFAEKPVADLMEDRLRVPYPEIKVIWEPPVKKDAR